jgi:hypothetical protein
MEYFTTAEQERALNALYREFLDIKQAEIDEIERQTKRIQKFTARGHVHHPVRIFIVQDGRVYFREPKEENICTKRNGIKYVLDPDFRDKVADFISRHKNYKVAFFPSGKYGPCVDYVTNTPRVFPARMEADGEVLDVEDENKYSIGCG